MIDRRAALAVACHGLEGALPTFPDRVLDEEAWRRFEFEVKTQKLTGLLMAAIVAGDMLVTDAQLNEARAWHEQQLATALRLERQMLRVVPPLADAGLDVLVLKGPAVAHLAYPDPALRLFGDIDLLLRAEHFDAGIGLLLRDLEYRRPWGQIRPGFDARFGKGATLHGPDGLELDVHRTFVFGAFGLAVEADDLFAGPEPFVVGGHRLLALGPATRFLHACYHAALGSSTPRLVNLRDVVMQLPTDTDEVERVLRLTRRWQGEAVVARAIGLVHDRLDYTVDGPVAEAFLGHRLTRREQRALGSKVESGASFARQVAAALPYIDGPRDRAAFLAAVLMPTASSRTSHDSRSGVDWLRRGLASFLGEGKS